MELCRIAGYGNIMRYDGFTGFDGPSVPIPTGDPLWVLLGHSDCDGEIEVKDLTPLADRLEELLDKTTDEWVTFKIKQFVSGLRLAAASNEVVEFA